jgi:hypothetical protein
MWLTGRCGATFGLWLAGPAGAVRGGDEDSVVVVVVGWHRGWLMRVLCGWGRS